MTETAQSAPRIEVSVVLGTYNRFEVMKEAIESVRRAAGDLRYEIVVVDGGSIDGSREWLAAQHDVVLIGQRGLLTGAVIAFNLGFSYAVDSNAEFVCHFNDDARFETNGEPQLAAAVAYLREHIEVGEVAFAFDLRRRGFTFEQLHGKPYANFGVVRREAGMAVARAQGDPTGKAWWNPLYRTYSADCEFACWLWKLGWTIYPMQSAHVHDVNTQDAMRDTNTVLNTVGPQRDPGLFPDSHTFWDRWLPAANVIEQRAAEQTRWQNAKVHLGCGTHRLAGWVNVDGLQGPAVDVVLDFAELHRLPTGVVDTIYWCHGPEHIHPDKLPGVMAHLKRALKPGGKLLVATISYEGIWENRFKSKKNGSAWNAALYGECDSTHHPFLSHKQAFTQASLNELLLAAKFKDVRPWKLEEQPVIMKLNDYANSCRLVTVFSEGKA